MKSVLVLMLMACLTSLFGAERPNVLFIAVDDLRPELGCYGHSQIRSPNIDRLTATGVQFERAYCQFALCNPSRASLLSGRRPETLRVYTLAKFLRDGNPGVITLPQLFREHGYETRSYGKIFHAGNGNHDDTASWSAKPWHNLRDDAGASAKVSSKAARDPDTPDHSDEMPFEARNVEDEALLDGQIAARASRALNELKGKPFFLGVGFIRPHLPFVAPQKYWDLYDPAEIRLPSNPFLPKGAPEFASNDSSELRRYKGVPPSGPIPEELWSPLIHGYYACVSYVDAQIGKVVAELDRLGLRENTIIVLWGDHGYQLGEHGTWTKRTNWELATRVPLVVSAPGKRAGKSKALVELVDLYPTLAELCRLPAPSGLEGMSLVPLLDDPSKSWKKAAFSLYTRNDAELGRVLGRAIRTDRYRLVEWVVGDQKTFELYDHEVDPGENSSLAQYPENAHLVKELAGALDAGWRAALPPRN